MNRKHISAMKVLHFDYGGVLTIGDRSIEAGPCRYRAYYNEYGDGTCHIVEFRKLKKDHDGKLASDWEIDALGREVTHQLEQELMADLQQEQEEITASFDAHRWRGELA